VFWASAWDPHKPKKKNIRETLVKLNNVAEDRILVLT